MTRRRPPSSMRAVLARRTACAQARQKGAGVAYVRKDDTSYGRHYSSRLTGLLRAALAERRQWWAEERAWWEREGLKGDDPGE